MPMFTEGGIFVPTTRDYKLGDDIYLLLSLPDDPQRYPVAGKVGWITPANASGRPHAGRRRPLSGRREEPRRCKLRIEEALGTSISSVQADADDLSAGSAAEPGALRRGARAARHRRRCTSTRTAT